MSTSLKKRLNRLFGREYRRTTFQMSFAWFSAGFNYYGLLFILPRTLSSKTDDSQVLGSLLLVNLLQLPSAVVPALLMEIKFIGRKNILIICSVVQLAFCLACTFEKDEFNFQVFVTILTFSGLIYFDMLYPYTSEVFDTSIRGTGFSFASSWARFAGFLSPFALLGLHNIDKALPYAAMSVVSVLTVLNCLLLRADTTGVALDHILH